MGGSVRSGDCSDTLPVTATLGDSDPAEAGSGEVTGDDQAIFFDYLVEETAPGGGRLCGVDVKSRTVLWSGDLAGMVGHIAEDVAVLAG
jgi:hypothetical protein